MASSILLLWLASNVQMFLENNYKVKRISPKTLEELRAPHSVELTQASGKQG
jgi:hypothetical protein